MQAGSFFRAGMRQGFSEQTPRCLWRRQSGAAPLQLPGPSLPPRAPAPGCPDPAVGRCSPPAKCSPFAPSPLFCLVPRGNERRPLPAGARFSVAFARRDCPECSLCLGHLCRARHRTGQRRAPREVPARTPAGGGQAQGGGQASVRPCLLADSAPSRRRVSRRGVGDSGRDDCGGRSPDCARGCAGLLHAGRRPLCQRPVPGVTPPLPSGCFNLSQPSRVFLSFVPFLSGEVRGD